MGNGIVAGIYGMNGNMIGLPEISDAEGKVTFTGGIGSGTYILKTGSTLYETDDPGWDWLVNSVYFERYMVFRMFDYGYRKALSEQKEVIYKVIVKKVWEIIEEEKLNRGLYSLLYT